MIWQLAIKWVFTFVCELKTIYFCNPRGISSSGRAFAWHARGDPFDPGILHSFNNLEALDRQGLFCFRPTTNDYCFFSYTIPNIFNGY